MRMTWDEIALRMLINGASTEQHAAVAQIASLNIECPECCSTNEKESNDDATDPCLLCTVCGTQFEQFTEQQRQLDDLDLNLDLGSRKGPKQAVRS